MNLLWSFIELLQWWRHELVCEHEAWTDYVCVCVCALLLYGNGIRNRRKKYNNRQQQQRRRRRSYLGRCAGASSATCVRTTKRERVGEWESTVSGRARTTRVCLFFFDCCQGGCCSDQVALGWLTARIVVVASPSEHRSQSLPHRHKRTESMCTHTHRLTHTHARTLLLMFWFHMRAVVNYFSRARERARANMALATTRALSLSLSFASTALSLRVDSAGRKLNKIQRKCWFSFHSALKHRNEQIVVPPSQHTSQRSRRCRCSLSYCIVSSRIVPYRIASSRIVSFCCVS